MGIPLGSFNDRTYSVRSLSGGTLIRLWIMRSPLSLQPRLRRLRPIDYPERF